MITALRRVLGSLKNRPKMAMLFAESLLCWGKLF